MITLLVAAFAGLTGIKAKGSRTVAHTRLMGVARFVLVVLAPIVASIVCRARSGTRYAPSRQQNGQSYKLLVDSSADLHQRADSRADFGSSP